MKRGFSLQIKFCVGIILILGGFAGLLSYGLYRQLEDGLIQNVYEESQIILAELEATRKYVADTLRPKISSIVHSDEFILEAMSTTYVSTKIMEQFSSYFPNFTYKRAALFPRNPKNRADAFEASILERFGNDHTLKEWQGIVSRGNERFFVRMAPIYMESPCMRCHGDPEDAPARLITLYGRDNGFGKHEDAIAGMDVLSFPVESAMVRIRHQVLEVLGPSLLAVVAAMALVIALFRSLVVNRIANVEQFFTEFISDRSDLSRRIKPDQNDEIGQLCSGFNVMADRLSEIVKERDQLVEESVAQREKMRSLFDGITDKLMMITRDYTVLMANKASLTGFYNRSQETKCYQIIHGLSGPCSGCLLEKTFEEKKPVSGEICKDGQEVYLAHFYPMINKQNNEVESVVHYCKSITEKKQMEKHIMRAEKLASLGHLVAGVAHELNNPLGLIIFYAELLKKELPAGSEHLMDIEVITKHTETCLSVVQDLLKFARSAENKWDLGQLNDTVEQVTSVLEKQFTKDGITLEKHLDSTLPRMFFDRDKLQQVWMNLLLNSRQAIADGNGLIRVSTRLDETGENVLVEIEDDGEGIPADIMDKIFDPFFTTKELGTGTGLGLAVSYGIIKGHGGDIVAHSQLGAGAVFTVVLPKNFEAHVYA